MIKLYVTDGLALKLCSCECVSEYDRWLLLRRDVTGPV